MKKAILTLLLAASCVTSASILDAIKVLKLTFGEEIDIKQEVLTFDKTKLRQIEQKAQTRLDKPKSFLYKIDKKGVPVGYGVVIVKRIRTKPAAILYMTDTDKTLIAAEIVAFFEPKEYQPGKEWLGYLKGKKMQDKIKAGYDIPIISGATLSAKAISDGARIALAILQQY